MDGGPAPAKRMKPVKGSETERRHMAGDYMYETVSCVKTPVQHVTWIDEYGQDGDVLSPPTPAKPQP